MSEVKPKWVCQDLQCHCTRIKSSFRIRSRNLTTFITDLCILQSKNNTTILISDFHHVYILLTFYAFCEMNNWKSCFESYSRSVFFFGSFIVASWKEYNFTFLKGSGKCSPFGPPHKHFESYIIKLVSSSYKLVVRVSWYWRAKSQQSDD